VCAAQKAFCSRRRLKSLAGVSARGWNFARAPIKRWAEFIDFLSLSFSLGLRRFRSRECSATRVVCTGGGGRRGWFSPWYRASHRCRPLRPLGGRRRRARLSVGPGTAMDRLLPLLLLAIAGTSPRAPPTTRTPAACITKKTTLLYLRLAYFFLLSNAPILQSQLLWLDMASEGVV
jgi:hypothetical protein